MRRREEGEASVSEVAAHLTIAWRAGEDMEVDVEDHLASSRPVVLRKSGRHTCVSRKCSRNGCRGSGLTFDVGRMCLLSVSSRGKHCRSGKSSFFCACAHRECVRTPHELRETASVGGPTGFRPSRTLSVSQDHEPIHGRFVRTRRAQISIHRYAAVSRFSLLLQPIPPFQPARCSPLGLPSPP